VDVGLRTEAAIINELVKRGYHVLLPTGVNQRYDLVLDFGDRFVRAQCKTARLHDGVIEFATRSTRANRKGCFARDYRGEIEIFLAYCRELDRIYAVPVEEAPAHEMRLRLAPSRNGQAIGINLAEHYELPVPG
jgi:hypothetical protein